MTTQLHFPLSAHAQYSFLYNYLQDEGYRLLQTDIYFKNKETFQKFLDTTPHTLKTDLRPFSAGVCCVVDDIFLYVPDNLCISIFAKESLEQIGDFANKYVEFFRSEAARTIDISYYYTDRSSTKSQSISLDLDKLSHTYPELYPDIDVKLLNKEFVKSSDSILVLYGVPGVGKTTFLKYILDSGSYKNALYIKDINVLRDSSFWCGIVGNNYGVIILDDLDFALNPRQSGSDSDFVSNLLSYSDGIFEQRSKIIITTNQPINQMDEALIRPGRCFDFLTLEPLTQEQAWGFWTDILERPISQYHEYISHDAEIITQAEIMNAHRRLSSGVTRSYVRSNNTDSLEDRLADAGITLGDGKLMPFH